MEHREYQAPAGFVIDTILIKCVHCQEIMPPAHAALHKQMHAIEKSREKSKAQPVRRRPDTLGRQRRRGYRR